MVKKDTQPEDFRIEHNLISSQHDVFVEKDRKQLDRRNVEETEMILMDKVKKRKVVC